MTVTFTGILIVIIAMACLGYLLVSFFKAQRMKEVDRLQERKELMLSTSISDNLFLLKNTSLSGQTKRQYEQLVAAWQTLVSYQFSAIESELVGAAQYTDRMKLVKAKQQLRSVTELIESAEERVAELNQEVEELIQIEADNQMKNDDLRERYNEARKSVLSHSFDYGPAIETLEKNLQYLELDFTKYNECVANGDRIEARNILNTIESNVEELEEILEKIPVMYTQIKEDYEDSLEDLRTGYQRMVESRFNFEGINVPEKIDEIQEKLNEAKISIKNADLADAQALMDRCERDIRTLYDMMETELNAKEYVQTNMENIRLKLEEMTEQSRYAGIEVDRIAQSYILHDNEVERVAELTRYLQDETLKFKELAKNIADNTVIYTAIESVIKKIRRRIDELQEQLNEVSEAFSSLPLQEKEAKSNLDLHELDLRNLKRRIEKSHLPGLSDSYYQAFFDVTNQIEHLAKQLNRVRVDMREINHLETKLVNDLEALEVMTGQIVDSAVLTEYMIQHSNRFRYDHPEVDQAIREAQHLFYKEFKYRDSLAIIEKALYRVDQDGPRQVRRMYAEEKKRQ